MRKEYADASGHPGDDPGMLPIPHSAFRLDTVGHSHSMVDGGLELMS